MGVLMLKTVYYIDKSEWPFGFFDNGFEDCLSPATLPGCKLFLCIICDI